MTELHHPYQNSRNASWLRGNLHAHTSRSDGALSPQELINTYARAGHDFLMISDHDVLAGRSWLEGLDARGMTLIPGNEISRGSRHILHVNASELVPSLPDRQDVLKAIGEDPHSFSILCHPNWQEHFDYIAVSQMMGWRGWTGLEIYNGVVGRLKGSSYALDKWDQVLSQGRRVWGFANDDCHLPHEFGLGWNVVRSPDRSISSIVEALRRGNFYASTGVEIETLRVTGRRIFLKTKNAERIVVVSDFGQRLMHKDGAEIEFEAPREGTYFRLECWGRGEQFAWTQPFYQSPG